MTCLPVATSGPMCTVSSHRTSRMDSGSPSMSTHQVYMGAAPTDLSVAGLLLLCSQARGEARRTLEEGGVQALSITCCVISAFNFLCNCDYFSFLISYFVNLYFLFFSQLV